MTAAWVLCALFAQATKVTLAEEERDSAALAEGDSESAADGMSVDALLAIADRLADSDSDNKKYPLDGETENYNAEANTAELMNNEAEQRRYASEDAQQGSTEAMQQMMDTTGQMPFQVQQYAAPTPRPFLAQAQEDLAALQNIHAAPTHDLDVAAKQSEQELQAIENPRVVPVETTWVDHTAEDIAANRKKVHDVAEKIKRDFFAMKLPQPPASLLESQPAGPAESLIQRSIAASAALTAGDENAKAAVATQLLKQDSKHLQEDFEKSFDKGMEEGFKMEQQRAANAQTAAKQQQAEELAQRQAAAAAKEQQEIEMNELEMKSDQSLREHD